MDGIRSSIWAAQLMYLPHSFPPVLPKHPAKLISTQPEAELTFTDPAAITSARSSPTAMADITREDTMTAYEDFLDGIFFGESDYAYTYDALTRSSSSASTERVQCEYCGEWFEAGNDYRNHVMAAHSGN